MYTTPDVIGTTLIMAFSTVSLLSGRNNRMLHNMSEHVWKSFNHEPSFSFSQVRFGQYTSSFPTPLSEHSRSAV